MIKTDYKVYLHRRQDNGNVFYVGKGRRWRENSKNNRNKHWRRIVDKYGYYVEIVELNLDNKTACDIEKSLISFFGYDNLCNYTYGGEGSEGYKHTEEALSKMKGRKLSEEHKKKLTKSKLEKPTLYWKGKKRSEELKNKISETLSNPKRKEIEKMLIEGMDRKYISEKTNVKLTYIRGLACRMRKKGYEIEKKKN